MEVILFVCSVIACIIGVMTFVVGMTSRAQNEGILVQKIQQAIDGIEELKVEVKAVAASEQSLALTVQSHEEKIKTLFKMENSVEASTEALLSISKAINHIAYRGE